MTKLIIALVLVLSCLVDRVDQSSATTTWPIIPRPYHLACPNTPIHCDAEVVSGATPAAGSALTPAQFHQAYRLPCTPGGAVASVCPAPQQFGGQTIGIVDAGGDATLVSDLALFDTRFGLPACAPDNGCLYITNQFMQSAPLPPSYGWEDEIALDVETAHAICQTCRIVLVETQTNNSPDLSAGVNAAAMLGATEISNSYGGGDSNWNPAAYDHPGIAITASSDDSGWGAAWPASLPTVIAVGGTTLLTDVNGNYAGETAWSKAGSGCSALNTANPWQTSLPTWSATGCGAERGVADVSADADPETGALIASGGSWWQVGGTSLASPLIAAVIALAGGVAGVANPQSIPYEHFTAANSHDVIGGSNGTCSTTMCTAVAGYDGPTGLGSPNGVTGFEVHTPPAPTPTATPQPTSTPAPTSTPTPIHHRKPARPARPRWEMIPC